MDKISVVIPVFNAENTLRRCVESLAMGNNKEELEIILVEDKSTDRSWDLCLELQDEFSQVRAIQNSSNSGPSYTRNRGIEEATGNLLLFTDADDWVSCNYITSIYAEHKKNDCSLVLCGYKFIIDKTGERKDYLYSEKRGTIILDEPDRYFRLLNDVLLQQLWNKIFDLQLIKNNELHFDETQSMGEDTQFVLDYLYAAKPKQCVIINEPLYYYVRTEQSLMGKYNKVDINSGANRLKQLLEISAKNDPVVLNAYEKAVENNKIGLLYKIIHAELSHEKKINYIKAVETGAKAEQIYQKYNGIVRKEKIAAEYKKIKNYGDRLKQYLQGIKRKRIINNAKNDLKVKDFTIISQNCIGGVFCHDMGVAFSSPTVNLFFKANDFVKFVLDLKHYMSLPLLISWGEEYPIGFLGDVSIYFMHYTTCKEAREAWDRRKQRMNYSNLLVIDTDMEGFSEKTFENWNKINYRKILFTVNKDFADEDSVYFPELSGYDHVPDLIPDRKFYKDGKLIDIINDL